MFILKKVQAKLKEAKIIKSLIKAKVNKFKIKVMSKNSSIQNYECAKAFAQVMESIRKKNQRNQQSNQPKQKLEKYVERHNWGIPVQLFRYFNVYGPHEDHKDQPSPHSLFRRQAAADGVIRVFEGSEGVFRDFVPVERLIEVHKRFFDLDVCGVYNLGTGNVQSFMDVATSVAIETNAEIVTVPMPEISGYQRYTRADMTKTNAML